MFKYKEYYYILNGHTSLPMIESWFKVLKVDYVTACIALTNYLNLVKTNRYYWVFAHYHFQNYTNEQLTMLFRQPDSNIILGIEDSESDFKQKVDF
jgi:hypothetical protein